jgi:Type I phosphodiesterase / nucleotide pyrophosphatase
VNIMRGSLCDILPSVAAALHVAGAPDRLDMAARLGEPRRVIVLLVDGMGYHLLPAMAAHAPLIADVCSGRLGQLVELACTLPSTTPTSLVSLGTGQTPGAHGILGFTVNVPGTDRVLTHVSWRDDPPSRTWQPVPTWFERMTAAGVPCTVVLPAVFAGSGLTDSAYRGARFSGVHRDDDYARRLLDALADGAGVVYGYTPPLDTAAHIFGIESEEWAAAAKSVDELLTRLLAALPPDAALVVTADHGGLDIPADARIDLDADPELSAGVRIVAGEARLRYLHTADGEAPDVIERWRAVLGSRAEVVSRKEAIAADWFGPVPEEHQARIGDVVVMCTAPIAVLATRHEPPEVGKLVGFHGAATPAETAIPLITLRR